ncbi:TetR family transcriptional regulator [Burkholderia sp. THE68]|uniref:TetR/AcrR family transcriptional regulator n=1 Tax=Burkholderiaceae TaxID=119060 RepID=UPI0013160F4F|nr:MULTISPECIES: TetR/AcrR family transcriptional regulator [Burkholderiaceae]BBU29933.1 TetR family transcriptional regulator [Burkholderia sp. THE68]BCQ25774.1 TetR family transcriptional regulator [Caballeronia sp. NK8]
MKPVRLTREQSRDQTRQRLLDAAQAVFIKKGFGASSVEDVAADAGYTRGAFYSNFSSKAELLLNVLKRDHDTIMQRMSALFEDGEASRADMEARVLQYYSECYQNNACFLLWVEAKLHASRDPGFRASFNALMRELRQTTTDYIRAFSERVGTPLTMPPEQMALGLIALCDGVQFFYSSDPQSVPAQFAEDVLAQFFRRVVLSGAPE